MSDERLIQAGATIEIGTDRYNFTPETQQFLDRAYVSQYPKDASVVIVNEPHESSEGHFNLFKGLESFFANNPKLVRQTIFLSEGTAADKPISVQPLIDEDPHPTDEIIRQVLQSHLITGYMAYEWKHQQGIPIVGTEDAGLYELSRRFASLCRKDPKALFKQLKHADGTEFDVPLVFAWEFAVAARNRRIAETLVEQSKRYQNPMLFVAWDHVMKIKDEQSDDIFDFIKKSLIDAQYMGVMGALMFPWSMAADDWWLHRNATKDNENFDIHHYLEQEKIGYSFLSPRGVKKVTPEDSRNYEQVFYAQRK
ncbi:MAG: hypothetical protein Q7R79_04670 [bacterium]|nr:hypothetical protein [bacterium]